MSDKNLERRINIKFCVKIGKSASETLALLTVADIQCKVKMLLRGIPENSFQDCFQQWHHHLTKCTASPGEYFEGDISH